MYCTINIKRMKKPLFAAAAMLTAAAVSCAAYFRPVKTNAGEDFIKWMDFNITAQAMRDTMELDCLSNEDDYPVSWIDILAYLCTKYGNDFSKYKKSDAQEFYEKIKQGSSAQELCADMKYFSYYKQCCKAVLDGFLGDYTITGPDGTTTKKYGLTAFCPIGEGFEFSHYDDFGASRSFGFKRKHLGNDLLGRIGSPIVAIEGGTVEAIGWNRYGGWRIGIRSFDKKRYYYYAHLRKDNPYAAGLTEGARVEAGRVIGYLGMTGYSSKENVNNINIPHLHVGMQIIFDESQKDGSGEIWIDMYHIIELLSGHKSTLIKNENGEYERKFKVTLPEVDIVDNQH